MKPTTMAHSGLRPASIGVNSVSIKPQPFVPNSVVRSTPSMQMSANSNVRMSAVNNRAENSLKTFATSQSSAYSGLSAKKVGRTAIGGQKVATPANLRM